MLIWWLPTRRNVANVRNRPVPSLSPLRFLFAVVRYMQWTGSKLCVCRLIWVQSRVSQRSMSRNVESEFSCQQRMPCRVERTIHITGASSSTTANAGRTHWWDGLHRKLRKQNWMLLVCIEIYFSDRHSSGDPLSNMRVEFGSADEAISHCERNGWRWFVDNPEVVKKSRVKNYGVNFAWNKRTRVSTKWNANPSQAV